MFRNLALTALGTTLALPAFAGKLDYTPPEPTVVAVPVPVALPDWSGVYFGGQVGYGMGEAADEDADGILGGLHLGYNHDFGTLVLGGEIDHDFSSIELDNDAGSLDNISRAKLKVGADLGRTLLYGTGGLAMANAEVGGADLSDQGYFVGAGMAYKVTDSVSVGGEYLYHMFDDFDDSGADVNLSTLTARVSYNF